MIYAKVENGEVVAIGLPTTGVLNDHRTVSNYNQLGIDMLEREGWLPVTGEKPSYNESTHYLTTSYSIEESQVIATYTVVEKPSEPLTADEKIDLLQNAVDFILMNY